MMRRLRARIAKENGLLHPAALHIPVPLRAAA